MKIRLAGVAVLLALWTAPALAQGCAMCYSSALGTNGKSQKALSRGVIVLLIPPVGMMLGLVGAGFAYAHRRDRGGEVADVVENTSADDEFVDITPHY